MKELKMKSSKQSKERDQLAQRVAFLEKQIVELRQDNPNQNGFIKATIYDDSQQEYPHISGKDQTTLTTDVKLQMIKDLESEN